MAQLRQARAIAVGRKDDGARCGSRDGERFSARPGAQVEDMLAVLRLASERDQLTSLVLDFDQPAR